MVVAVVGGAMCDVQRARQEILALNLSCTFKIPLQTCP